MKDIANVPIMALTATATPKVQLDIQKNLDMTDAVVLKSSFNRDNLFYEVRPKKTPSNKSCVTACNTLARAASCIV